MGFIQKIHFFGSLKDGFKCYPSSSAFDKYYDNTSDGWLFLAKKHSNITSYIYVKYGVLTSANDGRPGSCFGIAIDLVDCIFDDLVFLSSNFIAGGIIETMLAEEELITKYSGTQIAFLPHKLSNVQPYLDRWIDRIKSVFAEKELSHRLRPISVNTPDAKDKLVGLHPLSKPTVINDYFEEYGAVVLSPKYKVENISPAERRVREEALQARTQNEKKEQYISRLEISLKKTETLLQEKDLLLREKDEVIVQLKTINSELQIQIDNNRGTLTSQVVKDYHGFWKKLFNLPKRKIEKSSKRKKNKSVPLLILSLVIVPIIGLLLFTYENVKDTSIDTFSDTSVPPQDLLQPNKRVGVKNPNIEESQVELNKILEDQCLYKTQEETYGILRPDEFLKYVQQNHSSVSSLEEFRIHLTSYLWDNSTIVKSYYGDIDKLWDAIEKTNPNSIKRIEDFIESNLKDFPSFQGEVPYNTGLFWKKAIHYLIIVDYSN